MAEPQSNARLRADAGAPTSGVIHVRTRLTADFTVIANALLQRRGSAVTIGVAAYILSLPDGTADSIAALCDHFDEGEILISRALRELEAAGYLERRRERGPDGQIRTRTFFYDVPPGRGRPTPPSPPKPRRPSEPSAPPQETTPPAPTAPAAPRTAVDEPAPPLDEADPRAVVILASLRLVDRRLILSRREASELAPAVASWLAQGLGPEEITSALTADLPDRLRCRPARLLTFRLNEVPLVASADRGAPPPSRPAVLPWQTCDGCERAFRAPEPGPCRDCRGAGRAHTATQAAA